MDNQKFSPQKGTTRDFLVVPFVITVKRFVHNILIAQEELKKKHI
ncbi:MAG: hypothetical protein ACO1OT_13040 [Heyndrickxia sp.]